LGETMPKKKKEEGKDWLLWIAIALVVILVLKGLGLLKLWFNIDPEGFTINIDIGYLASATLFIYVLTRTHKLSDMLSKHGELLTEVKTKITYLEKEIDDLKKMKLKKDIGEKMFESEKESIYRKQLELELLETLETTIIWVIGYAKKHNIPIPNQENLASLLRKASTLIGELYSSPTDKWTEPHLWFCKFIGLWIRHKCTHKPSNTHLYIRGAIGFC